MHKVQRVAFESEVGRLIDQIEYFGSPQDSIPLFPSHIHIEPTNACNLRCIHCIQPVMQRKRGLMNFAIFKKIIDEIAPLQCSITLDVQGEPLLHPQILDMVEYSKKNNCYTSLITNATLLTSKKSEQLISMGLDRIVFSFDSIDKEIYEKVRIRGNFVNTLKNIETFIDLNSQSGHPVFICMSAVVQEQTKKAIQQYREYFTGKEIDTIYTCTLLNMSGYSRTANQVDITKKNNKVICRLPWESIVVNWNGDVCPCPVDFEAQWLVGNVREHSLQELWNNEQFCHFRQLHLLGDLEATCVVRDLCNKCSALLDSEYDMRHFSRYAKKRIIRLCEQYMYDLRDK